MISERSEAIQHFTVSCCYHRHSPHIYHCVVCCIGLYIGQQNRELPASILLIPVYCISFFCTLTVIGDLEEQS